MKKKETTYLLVGLFGGALALGLILFIVQRNQSTTQLRYISSQPTQPGSYKNDESWTVRRDTSGRLLGVDVHRDAKHT